MDMQIPYEDRENDILLALVKLAKAKKKMNFTQFGDLLGIPTAVAPDLGQNQPAGEGG
jgi:hypothetical protein